jgi:hypothetical protein
MQLNIFPAFGPLRAHNCYFGVRFKQVEFGLWKPISIFFCGFTCMGTDIEHHNIPSFDKGINQIACRVLSYGVSDPKWSQEGMTEKRVHVEDVVRYFDAK